MTSVRQFQGLVWDYYHENGRDLPWRHKPLLPYRILVSEIMLQQTQVGRVIPKYHEFLRLFPTPASLASASLADVIKTWSGLGYNRRAKYLHDAAKQLQNKPIWTLEDLVACKGIGLNTASAVMVYAYNKPMTFIETNIRTVYIHHFFADRDDVTDKEIMNLLEATLDLERPREFFWALMDYGTQLKAAGGNAARRSKHYAKQSPFEGSHRQVRGQVLKLLAKQPQELNQLQTKVPDPRLAIALGQLQAEGLIAKTRDSYLLTS